MNVLIALCLLALQPVALRCRSVDSHAALGHGTPHSSESISESWESQESQESQKSQEANEPNLISPRRNIAEILLPLIDRGLSAERRPVHAKKVIQVLPLQGSKERNAAWPRLNPRKKHVVEITPLRGKGRNGKPLAYILAPAKSDTRLEYSKRPNKHRPDHELKDRSSHKSQKNKLKEIKESSSSEEDSEEITSESVEKEVSVEESKAISKNATDKTEDKAQVISDESNVISPFDQKSDSKETEADRSSLSQVSDEDKGSNVVYSDSTSDKSFSNLIEKSSSTDESNTFEQSQSLNSQVEKDTSESNDLSQTNDSKPSEEVSSSNSNDRHDDNSQSLSDSYLRESNSFDKEKEEEDIEINKSVSEDDNSSNENQPNEIKDKQFNIENSPIVNELAEYKEGGKTTSEPKYAEIQSAKEEPKFEISTEDTEKISKSIFEIQDEKEYVLVTQDRPSHPKVNPEEKSLGNQTTEKNENQQVQDNEAKNSEQIVNENTNTKKSAVESPTEKDLEHKNNKDDYEDKIHLKSHNDHRTYKEGYEYRHTGHKHSVGTEDSKHSKTVEQKDKSDEDTVNVPTKMSNTDDQNTDEQNIFENTPDLEEVKNKSSSENETNPKETNYKHAAKDLKEEKGTTVDPTPSLLDEHKEESKTEVPSVTNKNKNNGSENSSEKDIEDSKSVTLKPRSYQVNLAEDSKVEKSIEKHIPEIPDENNKSVHPVIENLPEQPIEQNDPSNSVSKRSEKPTGESDTSKTTTTDIITTEKPNGIITKEPLVEESTTSIPIVESKTDSKKEIKEKDNNIDILEESSEKMMTIKPESENSKKGSFVTGSPERIGSSPLRKKSNDSPVEGVDKIDSDLHLKSTYPSPEHHDILIAQQDGINKLWEPDSRNIIELIPSSAEHGAPAACDSHHGVPSDKLREHTHQHKSYRLSFLFNK